MLVQAEFGFEDIDRSAAETYCKHFIGRPFRGGSVTHDEWLWLWTNCLQRKPINILEIGTLHYTSSLAFLRAMEVLPKTRLWSADLLHRAREKFKFNDEYVSSRWIRLIGKSQDIVPCINVKFDFIFIDGDHTYDGITRDFNNCRESLSDNGVIICHDSEGTRRGGDRPQGVRDALCDCLGENSFIWYPGTHPGEKKGFAVYEANR